MKNKDLEFLNHIISPKNKTEAIELINGAACLVPQYMRRLKKENDKPENGTGPWQIRMIETMVLSFTKQEHAERAADVINGCIQDAIARYVKSIEQVVDGLFDQDPEYITYHTTSEVKELNKWVVEAKKPAVRLMPGETSVRPSMSWVCNVDGDDIENRDRLCAAVAEDLRAIRGGYIAMVFDFSDLLIK